jgi:hypothetical protein
LGKKIPCSGSLFDAGKAMTRLRPLLGHSGERGTGPGWALPGRKKRRRKIVGHVRIWPNRLRKIRNSPFSNLFINFKVI